MIIVRNILLFYFIKLLNSLAIDCNYALNPSKMFKTEYEFSLFVQYPTLFVTDIQKYTDIILNCSTFKSAMV